VVFVGATLLIEGLCLLPEFPCPINKSELDFCVWLRLNGLLRMMSAFIFGTFWQVYNRKIELEIDKIESTAFQSYFWIYPFLFKKIEL